MKVAFCSAEVSPFAKVGGLADVAGSLPKELTRLGHEVVVFMPAYGLVVNDPQWKAKKIATDVLVKVNGSRLERATVFEILHDSLKVWLIECGNLFGRIERSEEVYSPRRDDYLFFSRAVLDVCESLNWIPDVVSAHDWHMGFLPVMIDQETRPKFANTASTFTIHNLAYQGEFGFDTLDAAGVSHELYNMHQLETFGTVNFLKAGCAFADQVNTVSENYAREVQTPEFGCKLEGLMQHLASQRRLRGILNGIDVDVHNPETDPELKHHFSAKALAGKAKMRGALLHELGLNLADSQPLLSVISRLSNQKGFDLMVESADEFLAMDTGWVVLGTGDPWSAERLRALEAKYPGKVRFVEAFDAQLAQRIYAGSDIFLMPSSFEPCGLGQLFAMRYGTVPVVRSTGGLADTVHEPINGFTFHERSSAALIDSIRRAVTAFRSNQWKELMSAGMLGDYSWTKSAVKYETMFSDALIHRAATRDAIQNQKSVSA